MEEKLLKDYTIKEFFIFLGKKRLEVISLIDEYKKCWKKIKNIVIEVIKILLKF